MNNQKKHVYLELFDADFIFVICPFGEIQKELKGMVTKNRWEELLEKLGNTEYSPQKKGSTWWFSGGGSVIWLPKYDKFNLLHEVVHAAHHLLRSRGMELDLSNDELYAYLIAWLYKKAL